MLQFNREKLHEEPAAEMQRLLRTIAGEKRADENNKSLLSRVYRRLQLGDLTHRTLESYWRGTVRDVPSHHMDRARELAFVQPLQEAQDAVERAEAFLEGLRARLAASAGTAVRRVGTGGGSMQPRRSVRSTSDGDRLPSGFSPPLSLEVAR